MQAPTIAIDAALSSRGLRDYFRGIGDSRRYAALRQVGSDWFAEPIGGAEQMIVGPVNDNYLDGIRDGGCTIIAERSGGKRAA
jgi:hypothetical protein